MKFKKIYIVYKMFQYTMFQPFSVSLFLKQDQTCGDVLVYQ